MLSTKVREKSAGKMSSMHLLAVLLVPVVALIMSGAAPEVLAAGGWGDCEELPLEAEIRYEVNFTDNDTGIQIFADGDPWNYLMILEPDRDSMFNIRTSGNLKHFGLAELFSESNEPNWEDMSHSEIVNLFDEGVYKFFARSIEGEWLKGCAELSHEIPCAPTGLSPANGDNTVNSAAPVILTWDLVENMLNNDTAACSGDEIEIEAYQVIVENLDTENEFSIFVEADDDQVTIPPEFVKAAAAYAWEVLAIADNGNQTIAETWFCTDGIACPEPE